NRGYVRAGQLQTGDALLFLRQGSINQPSASEGLQILQQELLGHRYEQSEGAAGSGTDLRVVRREVHEAGQLHVKREAGQIPFLRQAMLIGIPMGGFRIQGQSRGGNQEGIYGRSPARYLRTNESEQPNVATRSAREGEPSLGRAHFFSARRQWHADQPTNAFGVGAAMARGISYTYWRSQTVLSIPAESLQSRHCQSRIESGYRGRRPDSPF